jgi:hypothetical protein
VPVAEFRNDDDAYLAWVGAHPEGYVVNIQRGLNPGDARLHRANCSTISGEPARGKTWTGPYIKLCSISIADLDAWTADRVGVPIRPCGVCRPATEARPGEPGVRGEMPRWSRPAADDQVGRVVAEAVYELEGLREGSREVWLWADRYIPFERLTPEQLRARAAVRDGLRSLSADPGEILDASYAGFKPTNMDVENLVLYNIDTGGACFVQGARYGVRFELAHGGRKEAPSGKVFASSYRYRFVAADDEPAYWRRMSRIAAFQSASLGSFGPTHRLEQTWLAVHRAHVELGDEGRGGETKFGTFLTLDVPRGERGELRPELVKSLVDGVVASFQAQREERTFNEAARRIGAKLVKHQATLAGFAAAGL